MSHFIFCFMKFHEVVINFQFKTLHIPTFFLITIVLISHFFYFTYDSNYYCCTCPNLPDDSFFYLFRESVFSHVHFPACQNSSSIPVHSPKDLPFYPFTSSQKISFFFTPLIHHSLFSSHFLLSPFSRSFVLHQPPCFQHSASRFSVQSR